MSEQRDAGPVTTQTLLNLTQAAEAVGITRKTLYKHLSNGKLSTVRDAAGRRCVDVSELIRVYGKVTLPQSQVNAGKQVAEKRTDVAEETAQALDSMRLELERLREMVQAQAETQRLLLEDTRRRDEQAAELVRLQNEADELRRELAQERSKGLWARLMGK